MAAQDTTQLLEAMRGGDREAARSLMSCVYDELRAIARRQLRNERAGHSLQATALVHEAYLRLVDHKAGWESRAHFFAIAAQAIRRILVDHARMRGRLKRQAGGQRVALDDSVAWTADRDVDLLALDEALGHLQKLDARQARVVELRFFAGLTVKEVAEVLGVSPRTVDGDWAMARGWLLGELTKGQMHDS